MSQFRFQYSTDWPPPMAMVVIATVPIADLYLFFQRYLVGGLAAGRSRVSLLLFPQTAAAATLGPPKLRRVVRMENLR